ncbi:MAG: GtrA family protein [Legionellaceae bacterium]|nr:GtrA family protein [Legionellaceae bacterium]
MKRLASLVSKIRANNFWRRIQRITKYTFVRYLMVGITNTTVCFSIMYLGALSGLHYLSYTALGYLVAILYSFFMNLYFTFRVEGQILKRLTLFFAINLTNLGLVEIIEYIMIDKFNLNRLFSILSAMTWYVITGFLINSYLVYSRRIK